jgi:N-acetylmuramoyl-L-alanine amidase
MLTGQKHFHTAFAPFSPVFALRALLAFSAALFCSGALVAKAHAGEPEATYSVKRQAASSQFSRAEELRSLLNSKAPEKRTLAEYKQAIANYRRVTLITPRAPEVPDSLLAIAELFSEMGDRFGRSYYQSAVDTYGYLVREYPTSKYCQDSLLRAAKLQRNQLGDSAAANATYEDFVKRYPRSPRRREAQEGLAEIALLENSERPAPAVNTPVKTAPPSARSSPAIVTEVVEITPSPAAATPAAFTHSGGMPNDDATGNAPRVRRIRSSANGEATRVTIDLEGSVQYSSARISNPERIFFDLHAARLTPEVARGNIQVDGRLLTAVRVAQNQTGVVRVVLDVNGVKDYTASLSSNPPQLIIDLYGTVAADTPVRSAKLKRDLRMPPPVPATAENARANTAGDIGTSADIVLDGAEPVSGRTSASLPPQSRTGNSAAPASAPQATVAANVNAMSATPTGAPNPTANGVVNERSQRAKTPKATSVSTKPDLIRPASSPTATHDGQSTLTRTLGLKIGRIVIDAGHGGHDTGTIGPTGLMEKDLCLDVALRLGKLIQQKLPGADVVYTRSDDTFIPLEERTNIANQTKADLFISIHANSSQDHAARGIETYYLNLRGTPESMEVAARENATSQQGIHDLQDVVRQIARTEKIDESKEFAEDVQDSLSKRIQRSAKTVKNRGVRKAPFVVLIGADMPSILTEISFLSNPSDEQLLKKPDQRQHVAEGIFSGVASYLESLNSVAFNQPGKPARSHSPTPPVEESSNQK